MGAYGAGTHRRARPGHQKVAVMTTSAGIGDPRLFATIGPHALAAVAQAVGCAPPSREAVLTGLAGLENAGPEHVSFLGSKRLVTQLDHTRAGCRFALTTGI